MSGQECDDSTLYSLNFLLLLFQRNVCTTRFEFNTMIGILVLFVATLLYIQFGPCLVTRVQFTIYFVVVIGRSAVRNQSFKMHSFTVRALAVTSYTKIPQWIFN